ncbi:MAG TPA: hypothetical protein DDY39_02780, partial [Nitrospira sp.]|nr:hypothetical protein [Nitrospira sp.]
LNYCRRLLADQHDVSSLWWVLMGFGVHSVAFARDVALQLGRTVEYGSRRSWSLASQAEKDRWRSVWTRLVSDYTVLMHV